ncbi:MAG: hypothetical protein ACXAC5_17420 [Promethearchaeota archaeon]
MFVTKTIRALHLRWFDTDSTSNLVQNLIFLSLLHSTVLPPFGQIYFSDILPVPLLDI